MKTVTIVDKSLSPNDFDSLYNFILAEIKKLTGLHSDKIPFVISLAEIQTEDVLTLNVQWVAYDEPHTSALQTMYRENDSRMLALSGVKENHLGFVDAAETLVIYFIKLYFSI